MKILDAFYSGRLTRDAWQAMNANERRRAFLSDIAVAFCGAAIIYLIFGGQ